MRLEALLVIPLAGVFASLLTGKHPHRQAAIALATSLASLAASLALWVGPPAEAVFAGGWEPPLGIPLAADMLSRLMVTLTGTLFSAATLYNWGETVRGAKGTDNVFYQLAFPFLLLALNGLFITADFFNFYVFFELVAVASYLLVSLGKRYPLEAAWKYSAQSVVGSICLLVAVVLLYSETGVLAMADVAARLEGPIYVLAPFFLAAFLLKGALFPFHFWQPDAHAAATTAGSMVLAGVLIKVGLYGLLRFWPLLLGQELNGIFLVIGAASVAFGAWAAFQQADAKRLLGFSSVSQLGFVLLAFGWGTPFAWGAAIFFLISHSLAKALLFAATGALADRAGSTKLEALQGAGAGLPWLSAAYLLGVISLIGLPPTAGFVAKIGLLQAGVGLGAWPWVAIAAVGSLMTLGYGVRAYQILFWATGSAALERPGRSAIAATGLLAVALVACGVLSGPLWEACQAGAAGLIAPGPGR